MHRQRPEVFDGPSGRERAEAVVAQLHFTGPEPWRSTAAGRHCIQVSTLCGRAAELGASRSPWRVSRASVGRSIAWRSSRRAQREQSMEL